MTNYATEEDRIAAQARAADRKRRREVNANRKKKGEPPLRDDEPTPQFVKKTPEEIKKRKAAEKTARRLKYAPVVCECGHTINHSDGKAQHLKSDIHLHWMMDNTTTHEERAALISKRHAIRRVERLYYGDYRDKQRAKIAEEIAMMQLEDKQ